MSKFLLLLCIYFLSTPAISQTLEGKVEQTDTFNTVELQADQTTGEQKVAAIWHQYQAGIEAQPVRNTRLQGRTGDKLSAVGLELAPDGRIIQVDPGSDLFGKVRPGDIAESYNGENPIRYIRDRKNYGGADSIVRIQIRHRYGGEEFFMARRKPVTDFASSYQTGMLPPN